MELELKYLEVACHLQESIKSVDTLSKDCSSFRSHNLLQSPNGLTIRDAADKMPVNKHSSC